MIGTKPKTEGILSPIEREFQNITRESTILIILL